MQDTVIFQKDDTRLTAKLLCDIDHHTAKRMREKIDKALFDVKPGELLLDFSAVGFMDSSGLGLILGRCETASALHISVKLVGLSTQLMKLLRLAGLERVKNLSI